MAKKITKPDKPAPNIKFIGQSEPFESFETPTGRFEIAPAAVQQKPFYHENAARIILQWPDRYKPVARKGKNKK